MRPTVHLIQREESRQLPQQITERCLQFADIGKNLEYINENPCKCKGFVLSLKGRKKTRTDLPEVVLVEEISFEGVCCTEEKTKWRKEK